MPSSLPLELQQYIIAHALQSVCKTWRHSIGRWKEVELFNVDQIVGLNRVLLNQRLVGDARREVKSVHVRLDRAVRDSRASQKLTVLLSLVVEVERVEFVVCVDGLVQRGGKEGNDSLGHNVRTALYQNTKLKHLAICGSSASNKADISAHLFDSLHYSWPELESLTLAHMTISMPYGREQLFARGCVRYPKGLTTLILDADVRSEVVAGLLTELPPDLVNLHITHPTIYTDSILVGLVNKHLAPVAPRLRALTLLPDDGTSSKPRLPLDDEIQIVLPSPTARGAYNALVKLLTNVRSLLVTPSAVSDFGATLGPLDQLRKLTLGPTIASCGAPVPVGASELVSLIKGSRLLEGVTVASEIAAGWSADGLEEVRAAAVRRSVGFSA